MTVRFHGVRGGLSSPQLKAGSITTHLGKPARAVGVVGHQVALVHRAASIE